MGVTVRPLTAVDRQVVERMLVASRGFSAEEVRVALQMVDEGIAQGPVDGYVLLGVEVDGVLGGYAYIGATPLTLSTWHVYWICVHPDVQGRGVGRALQAHVEAYVRSHGGERLVVETSGRPDYARSRQYYEAAGFQMSGRIPDYYKPGDDCVWYCKVL